MKSFAVSGLGLSSGVALPQHRMEFFDKSIGLESPVILKPTIYYAKSCRPVVKTNSQLEYSKPNQQLTRLCVQLSATPIPKNPLLMSSRAMKPVITLARGPVGLSIGADL